MEVLSEDSINKWIVPSLSKGKRGHQQEAVYWQIISAILYKLKTGCQWRALPCRQFFEERVLSWQGVYYHFRKWASDGSLRKAWINLLKAHHRQLDLSSMQIDGSQSICKNGGAFIGYQPRKGARTCNSLFLADNKGTMLSCSFPVAGQHHDLYEIEKVMQELTDLLKEADISTEGVFLNADAGFDAMAFRKLCGAFKMEANIDLNPRNGVRDEYVYFDPKLYKSRIVIEQANAWLDSFKTLLIRFETKALHWIAMHWMAFICLFIKKLNKT